MTKQPHLDLSCEHTEVRKKDNVCILPVARQAEACPRFSDMKRPGVCMGYWSNAGLPPALISPVPIYKPGWREALRE